MSIVTPLWNTQPQWLFELAQSILSQSSASWEWCLVDDGSTETAFHELLSILEDLPNVKIGRAAGRQGGISRATNQGLELASAEFVCFVDHDDLLAPDAVAACLALLQSSGSDAVYTDSDKIDENGRRSEPFHKPAWSPEYFRGVMYVGHLLAVRRSLALEAGGFDPTYDRIQDFEFMLRFSERTGRIAHLPSVLYHWRTVAGSVATDSAAKGDISDLQCRAVQAQLDRLGLRAVAKPGKFAHRTRILPLPRTSFPKVSIIIPTKDHPDLLRACLHSLFRKTTYPNFEVLCIDNDTSDPEALAELRRAPIERVLLPGTFNYSKANNLGLKYAAGEYLVFMNNDIEVITAEWIEELLYYAEQPGVGAVGGLLVYPNGTIQHAGVVLGVEGVADHVLRFGDPDSDGYAGSLSCAHEVSAVTAACLMMPRSLFEQLGRFNEHFFTFYQDVDLCLKIRQQQQRIIFNPHARFVHHESVSRGKYYDLVDRNLLLDFWEETISDGDPYYNPNFDPHAANYSLRSAAAPR